MSHGVVLHSISKGKLFEFFEKKIIDKIGTSLYLHSFGYFPWEDNSLKNEIISFSSYNAFITSKTPVESIIELIYKAKEKIITIVDEDDPKNLLTLTKSDLLKLNLDSKYKSIKWFMNDLKSQVNKDNTVEKDDSEDYERFNKKIKSKLFNERIIYVDGGMGDHVMALPLLEKLSSKVYICCKYPFLFEHIPNLGFIDWNDDLFGGYKRFVYEYGSSNDSKTIIDAFFEMYGEFRNDSDLMIYNGKKIFNLETPIGKNLALICTSAAKIQNQESNKDWTDIRWFKLVNELKKKNYHVIQVGSKGDNQIPNVDYKFLDKSISELAGIIKESSLWVTVDTFFHHFASSIKPNVGICLTPFYNDHAKHSGVRYIEKDCGKNYFDRRWWLDLQQPERKECMDLINLEDIIKFI